MPTILVPIDGSKNSVKALSYVEGRRGRGERFDVRVVNVLQNIESGRFVGRKLIKQWQKAEFESLVNDVAVRDALRRLEAKVTMLVGDPAAAITRYAKTQHCDEIVMGTRGMGAIKGMLLGSVANKVLHLASIPVTLVR